MGSYVNPIVQGEPTSPELTVPGTVATYQKPRITPKIRAGYFWVNDRRHYLFARKSSCYLSDLTWHVFTLADQPIPASERVWVRGVEITGTTQYFFQGNKIWVNGGAFTHPNTRWSVVEQDHGLTPYESRDMLVPGDEVRVDYNYYDYSAGTLSAGAGNFQDAVNPGILVTPNRTGSWADTWTITIPVATATPASATLDLATQTITLTNWNAASTTIQNAIDALNAVAGPFTFAHDGVGSASALLATSITAFGGAPISETFAGGVNGGNTSTNIVEIQDVVDGEVVYKFDEAPKSGSPIVMTDDRFYHWDGRDIAPEFTVSEDGYIEFNTPHNYVINPDFEGDPLLPIEWASSGTVEVLNSGNFATDLYPRSGKHYVRVDTTDIVQVLPAFGSVEMLLSFAAAGADEFDVEVEFFDLTWTSLGSDTWSTAGMQSTSWVVFNRKYGPAGRERTYDFNIPADATYAVLTITTAVSDSFLDYVFWGRTPLEPDHWHPHPLITVEFETDESDDYYEHHPTISYDPEGLPIVNLYPMDPVNLSSADNYEVTGFLYWNEDCLVDFRLGLGGTRTIPVSVNDGAPLSWVVPNTANGDAIAIDGDGGYFVGGANNQIIHINKYGVQDGTVAANGAIGALWYDYDNETLYVGGAFTTLDSVARNRLAAYSWRFRQVTDWNPGSGTAIEHIGPGLNDAVVVAFGATGNTVGGASRDCFAEISKVDGVATAWDPGDITGGGGLQVFYDDVNDIYIGAGSFTTATGDFLRYWDSSGNLAAGFDPAPNDVVAAFDYDPNTMMLYAGGDFTNIYATARDRLVLIDVANDALDATFTPAVDDIVLAVRNIGEQVFIGGDFNTINGDARANLGAVDLTGATLDFLPAPDNLVQHMASDGVTLGVAGNFNQISAGTYDGYAFFPVYTGEEARGRKHVPYAKTDGLGKLAHEGILRYNAQPWVREVTWCIEGPKPAGILIDDGQFVLRDNGNGLVTDPVAGDVNLDATVSGNDEHVQNVVTQAFAVISDTNNREVIRIREWSATDRILLHPVRNTYSGASLDILYPIFKIYVDQTKWIRGRIVDGNGAPVQGVEVELVSQSAEYSLGERFDTTNQDGEFKYLITGVNATPAGPEYLKIRTGSLEKLISVWIEALP